MLLVYWPAALNWCRRDCWLCLWTQLAPCVVPLESLVVFTLSGVCSVKEAVCKICHPFTFVIEKTGIFLEGSDYFLFELRSKLWQTEHRAFPQLNWSFSRWLILTIIVLFKYYKFQLRTYVTCCTSSLIAISLCMQQLQGRELEDDIVQTTDGCEIQVMARAMTELQTHTGHPCAITRAIFQ